MRKRKHALVTLLTILVATFSLVGCASEEEETTSKYLKDGTYAPGYNTYILKLPSEDWEIDGKEKEDNIKFLWKKNEISLQRFQKSEEKFLEKKEQIPTTQTQLEEFLKENNIKDYAINSFKSDVYYEENYNFSTTQYTYTDADGNIKIFYSFYNENYLYEINGNTTDEEIAEEIEIAFNDFIYLQHDEKINVFKLKEKTLEGNTYNSKNNDFTLSLSYANWNFQVPEDYSDNQTTTISTDGMTITIQKQSANNSSNTLIYEIPKTVEVLNKQIGMKNLGQYNLIDYKVKTVGVLPDYNEKQEFTTFSYLIKCNENTDMKYYAYKEYRTENVTYQLTGTLTIDDYEKANELNQILKSFYPTSNY